MVCDGTSYRVIKCNRICIDRTLKGRARKETRLLLLDDPKLRFESLIYANRKNRLFR